jgi:hypothetical protein
LLSTFLALDLYVEELVHVFVELDELDELDDPDDHESVQVVVVDDHHDC